MTMDRYQPDDELDVVQQGTELDASLARLSTWAASATAAYKVAEKLVETSFVPDGFRKRPYEACAAILAGVEVGLSPMAALRSFDIISGQAAARAITLRAIVQSHGHEMVLVESTGTRCKMQGRRRGTDNWTTVTWTMDRARDLGLAGKSNWKSQPQAMLVARATSELARLIAADAILGIGYSAEEVADGAGAGVDVAAVTITPEPATGTPAEPSTGSKRLSRRRPTTEPEPAPEPPEPLELDPADDRPTEQQKRKLMATFGDLGLAGPELRADRLALTSALIGRTITSTNDVTGDEASRIIDQLVRLVDGELAATANDDGTWTITHTEGSS